MHQSVGSKIGNLTYMDCNSVVMSSNNAQKATKYDKEMS